MAFWRKKKPFDRTHQLGEADRHRAKGHTRRAIAGYRKILAVDPSDVTAHARIAPLLAKRGQYGESLASFHLAAQGQLKSGFVDRAISVYAQATSFFPLEANLWEELGRLYFKRERRADAINALLEGGKRLGKRPELRRDAVRLLSRALSIEPWHPASTLALVHVLRRDGQRTDARKLLAGLMTRVRGKDLRRARWALFRLSPTPGNFMRWLEALLGGR